MNVDVSTPLLGDVLKGVSRSFYLSLRVLPTELRAPIGIAYLLARAADTLADTCAVPPETRLTLIEQFRAYLFGECDIAQIEAIQHDLSGQLEHEQERQLLLRLPEVFALLQQQSEEDRALILNVVDTLTQGMCFDLTTFPPEQQGAGIHVLAQDEELDRYIFLVAGCVGDFWTRISHMHVLLLQQQDLEQGVELGIRFGKALQLTNVLRDLPRDLRIGRCYLPTESLRQYELCAQDLLRVENSQRARPLLLRYVQQALEYFSAAETYVLAIPASQRRLRLAALWPLLIGLATLAQLTAHPQWLEPDAVIKVKRAWVYRMMWRSLWQVGRDQALRDWFAELRAQVNLH